MTVMILEFIDSLDERLSRLSVHTEKFGEGLGDWLDRIFDGSIFRI
jgi:hypothetical protein